MYFAIMLNYAQVRQESYYAQIYAGIMCQGRVSSGGQGETSLVAFN